jgi:hypothetical protein
MALAFPPNPSGGDVFENWMWDGSAWVSGSGLFGEYLQVASDWSPFYTAFWLAPGEVGINLSPGDWDVQGTVTYDTSTGADFNYVVVSLNQGDPQTAGADTTATSQNWGQTPISIAQLIRISTPVVRFSLSQNATIYPVALASFTGSSGVIQAWSLITARRRAAVLPMGPGLIKGVTDGSDAPAGFVGEYLTNSMNSPVAGTGGGQNIISMYITPGDWDVGGNLFFSPTSALLTSAAAGVSDVSATLPQTPLLYAQYALPTGATGTMIGSIGLTAPTRRFNVTVQTMVYVVAFVQVVNGSVGIYGTVWARRVR